MTTDTIPAVTTLAIRISVDPKDAGFEPMGELLRIGDIDVYVDGKRCRGIITADSVEGFVECYDSSVDPDDLVDVDEWDWPTVILRGTVRIESRINSRTKVSRRATVLRLKANLPRD